MNAAEKQAKRPQDRPLEKPLKKLSSELFDDVPVLQRKWHAALRPGDELPRYEDDTTLDRRLAPANPSTIVGSTFRWACNRAWKAIHRDGCIDTPPRLRRIETIRQITCHEQPAKIGPNAVGGLLERVRRPAPVTFDKDCFFARCVN